MAELADDGAGSTRSALGQRRLFGPFLLALVLWSPRLLEDLAGNTTLRHILASELLQRALLVDVAIYLCIATSIALVAALSSPLLNLLKTPHGGAGDTRALVSASVLASSSLFLLFHSVLGPLLTRNAGVPWGLVFAGTLVLGMVLGTPVAALLRLGVERLRGRPADRIWYAVLMLLWAASTQPQLSRIVGQVLLLGSSLVAVWLLLPTSEASQANRRGRYVGVLGTSVVLPALILVGIAWLGPAPAVGLRLIDWLAGTPRSVTAVPVSRPNVVVVVVDTWRVDRTNPAGYAKATTPRLSAALDARTTWFERAHAAAPATHDSVLALITSRPPSHWSRSIWRNPIVPGWTMAEAFRSSGYQTAAFSGNSLISSMIFRNGYETIRVMGGEEFCLSSFLIQRVLVGGKNNQLELLRLIENWRLHKVRGQTIRELGRDWLRNREGSRPFFLYLHIIEPHWPYRDYGHGIIEDRIRTHDPLSYVDLLSEVSPGKEISAAITGGMEELLARYDESMREADDIVGGILDDLDALGIGNETLVVLVGDHGEEFLEHGGYSHGHDVYQELIHVPLVIRWPRSEAFRGIPTRITEPVSLLDVFPTLEDYLSLAVAPKPHAGSSLQPLLQGSRTSSRPPVIAEVITTRWRASHIEGDLKVRLEFGASQSPLEGGDVQVFDLGVDAGERTPLSAGDPAVADAIRRAREALQERWLAWPDRNPAAFSDAEQATEDDAVEQLRALGYVQ